MLRKILRTLALLAVTAIAITVTFSGKVAAIFGHEQSAGASASTPAERKVLYWYDVMHPERHYTKPGKASDGMDLAPRYANEDKNSQAPNLPSADGSEMKDMSRVGTGQQSSERKVLYWYDAMNPQRRYDKPGKAPDGMDLVPKYADGDNTAMSNMPAGTVKISAQKQQLIGVRTATVERIPLVRTITTTGQVTPDERRIEHIHLKISGWLNQVYVDYIGKLVKKGEPLFTIYSPDLVATEEEFLIASRGEKTLGSSQFTDVAAGAQSLLRSARERLKLWDISDAQIDQLEKTGQVTRDLTFYSPADGFVLDRKAFPHTSVSPDMELYTIVDLSNIWVNADIYEYEVPYIRIGQSATMQPSYFPGKTYSGRVTFIYPTVDPVSRTVKVRLEFSNPQFELKPQMFTNVKFTINYGQQILLPQEALLDSGEKQYVFLAGGDGIFEPRQVETGAKLDGKVMITSGLKPGDTVVLSGNFLIDSESRLKSAMGGMKH